MQTILKVVSTDSATFPRREGSRELLNVKDIVDAVILGMKYVVQSKERIHSAARDIPKVNEAVRGFKEERKNNRMNKWKQMELHGQFMIKAKTAGSPLALVQSRT